MRTSDSSLSSGDQPASYTLQCEGLTAWIRCAHVDKNTVATLEGWMRKKKGAVLADGA